MAEKNIEKTLAEGSHFQRYSDVIVTAGFPCQDISIANSSARGLAGERSGLIYKAIDIVRQIRPKLFIVENVPEFLNRGFGDFLAALAEIRYDAEWRIICSSQLGLEQRRKRLFVISYPHSFGVERLKSKPILEKLNLSSRQTEQPIQEIKEQFNTFESRLCRSLHVLPDGVHRVRGLGNAIVPQVAEVIMQAIKESEVISVR